MTRVLERALELFGELCDLAPEVLTRRLQEIDRSDRELGAALEALLRADRAPAPGLERGPTVPAGLLSKLVDPDRPLLGTGTSSKPRAEPRPDRDLSGQRIGEFTLLRCIGRGGMGVVWEAEQDEPRRRVALKVMRLGFTSVEGLQRFRHEVEFLGRLQHASIAQVFLAGTVELEGETVPYFAMELVPKARTLDEHVHASGLDMRARVHLFARICEAVQHGHQRGIIHRDLKPSNVLIGPDGVPKVIDFGVARATDLDVTLTTQRTRAGELVGTLAYMSPEQCDADPGGLDVRSDVYSLGVMLYELLCDRRPYSLEGLTILAAATVIRTREPEPPGRIDRRLRGDIEAVVLRAMEKDRRRRYSSAATLQGDLQRWLDGDPVEARVPGRIRRVIRWTGRHPILATTTASALTALGLLCSAFLAIHLLTRVPSHAVVDGNGRYAQVLSIAGAVVRVWDVEEALGVVHCELASGSDGDVVVLALAERAKSPWARQVSFFFVDDFDTPYWTSDQAPFTLPPDEPKREEFSFSPDRVLVGDVYPDEPGPEVAVAHRLGLFSATCIRIYSLRGEVLFETWNDGQITGFHYLGALHRLVVCGLDSETRWDVRGISMKDSMSRYPAVVFALDVRRRRPRHHSFLARSGRLLDSTVVWHRWLGPSEHLAPLQECLPMVEAQPSEKAEHQLQVCFQRNHDRWGLHMIIDGNGNEVTRFTDDTWKRIQGEGGVPDGSVYRLMDYSELP